MARKKKGSARADRLEKARAHIWGARRRLAGSLFGPLLAHVSVVECEGAPDDPLLACVDPVQGAVWVNSRLRPELGEAEWTFVIAHQLLHLALDHARRRLHRDSALWNLACDYAADAILQGFKIGRAPHDFPVDPTFNGMREEEIYDLLGSSRRATTFFKTFAGPGRPDIVRRSRAPSGSYASAGIGKRREDYENLFAEGIREAVERAVSTASEALGQEATKAETWRPAELARRWVMNELPLLGPLAAQIRIIADGNLCERMDIPIAAVNGFLGEMYVSDPAAEGSGH